MVDQISAAIARLKQCSDVLVSKARLRSETQGAIHKPPKRVGCLGNDP